MLLEAENLTFSYGGNNVLRGLTFSADCDELIAVLGPNGVGKSTFFRCLLGFLHPQSGEIRLDGKSITAYSRRELSRLAAYIPQSYSPAFDHSVLDCVLMAKAGSLGAFEKPGEADHQQAMALLEKLGIASLADRGCRRISGGERQLMLLARALLQDARLLIMDEPTANLDYGNALRVMSTMEVLAKQGYTILFSTHDPEQALRSASRVLAMQNGTVLADGAPGAVLTSEILSRLYSVNIHVGTVQTGSGSCPVCVPLGEEVQP